MSDEVKRFMRFLLCTAALVGAVCGLSFLLSGCAGLQEGPTDRTLQEAADLPKPPTPTTPALSSPAQRFDPSQGTLQGYRPRKVLPNGDAVGGHYVDINLQDVAVDEVIQPKVHIPRAPKTTVAPTATKVKQPKAAPVPPDAQGEPPPHVPTTVPTEVPPSMAPLLQMFPGVSINPKTGGFQGVVIPNR